MITLILTGLFYLILFSVGAGLLVSILVFVPLTIYVIPYLLWVGYQQTKGRYKDEKIDKIFKTAKRATILYKSLILKKEPTF